MNVNTIEDTMNGFRHKGSTLKRKSVSAYTPAIVRMMVICMLLTAFSTEMAGQGLLFHGNEVDIADRSGLVLPAPDTKVAPVAKLGVNFSLRINNVNSSGFIFGIKDRNNSTMLTLMLRHPSDSDSLYLSFNREGERELGRIVLSVKDVLRRKINVGVALNSDADKGEITIDGQTLPLSNLGLPGGNFKPQVNFGLTRHIVETASVTVADLKIESDGNVTEIPLNESRGEVVHDGYGHVAGRVHNPKWEINQAYYWRKLAEFSSPTPTGCAFNPQLQRFYSYNADSLTIYDDMSQTLWHMPLKGELRREHRDKFGGEGALPVRHGMNLFSSTNGKIYPYEIYYNDFTGEIDPTTGTWRELTASDDNKAIHHHAHIGCRNDSAVLLFGGYGDRMYFNKLTKFNLYTHKFDTIPLHGDEITPRFYAAMCGTASGDTLYLYGGKGNPEGRQDLGVKYYYDCFLINLKDSTVRKLWAQQAPDRQRVAARTLLTDADGRYIYAMTYPEYIPHSRLQLYRISPEDGSETAVGDTIPMISEEIATNVALYMPESKEEIYCVIQEFGKEGNTRTRIYSIAAPPVSAEQLSLYDGEERRSGTRWIWIALATVLGMSGIVIWRFRRKRSRDTHVSLSEISGNQPAEISPRPQSEASANQPSEAPEIPLTAESEIKSGNSDNVRNLDRPGLPQRDRISLFGPFTAIDAEGHDVSHLFSPKLRSIFIYILLATWRKGGVSSSELSAVFWPDKEADKIKNLRNVTIAKLRKILADFTNLEIVFDNGKFMMRTAVANGETGEGCFVDIDRLLSLTRNLTYEPDIDDTASNLHREIESIILQGKFLQGIEAVELDEYKSKVEAFTIDVMLRTMMWGAEEHLWNEVVRFSHLILLTDPVNETAMRYGVKAYEAQGNRSRARNLYDSFAANYRKIYGEDFQR